MNPARTNSSTSAAAGPAGQTTFRESCGRSLRGGTKAPAVSLKRKDAVFVEPVLIAEVEYRAWTDDGKLRHASFQRD